MVFQSNRFVAQDILDATVKYASRRYWVTTAVSQRLQPIVKVLAANSNNVLTHTNSKRLPRGAYSFTVTLD